MSMYNLDELTLVDELTLEKIEDEVRDLMAQYEREGLFDSENE